MYERVLNHSRGIANTILLSIDSRFLRGRPYLCQFMKRVGITQPGLDRRVKNKDNQNTEIELPDLYAMPTVK